MPRKKIADFSVARLQVLGPDGKVDPKLEPDLAEDDLLALYRGMVRARELDQRMLKLQRQGRIGTFGPCTGQEAVSTTAAFLMGERDWFVGAFRELGGRLMRGEPMTKVLHYYNGWEEGNVQPDGVGDRMTPIAVVVGSQIPHAAGVGYALKMRGEKAAAVCFMGDGATSQGDFHEGLNFAAVWDAPVVFVSQNNQWAISVPREVQTRSRTLAQKGVAYDMPCLQIDGNDVLACYVAFKEALDRAWAGDGPSFIEAETYRLLMHTTADDPRKYRDEEQEKQWWEREPLIRFRTYLTRKEIWDEKKEEALLAEVRGEVDAAVKEFETQTPWAPDAPFDHVYAEADPYIESQRREFLTALEEAKDDA